MKCIRRVASALAWAAAPIVVAAVFAASAPLQAADFTDLDLEALMATTVSSASKFVQSEREAPSAVEVITREDIRRHAWRTLSEALVSLTGVYGVTDRAYDRIGARGFLIPGDYNTRFLLLLDGQRIDDNTYGQSTFGHAFPVDLALVERIEYVPGPGSSIYGSNALFGVINVITRRAAQMPPAQLATRLSEDGWREGRVTLARTLDSGASVLLSATEASRPGRDDTYADPDGDLPQGGKVYGMDRQHKRQLFARYEDGGFALSGRYGERVVNPSTGLYGTLFNDRGQVADDRSINLGLRNQRQISDDLGIELRLEYVEQTYVADFPYADDDGNRYINRDDSLGRWWSGDVRFLYTGLANHKFVAGVEAKRDVLTRQRNFDVDVSIDTPLDVNSLRHRVGVYVQDEWRFADNWRLNAGLRHDAYSDGNATTNPRLGLIWLASEQTTFKLLAGRAYRAPNAYERDYACCDYYIGNADLSPETISTVEAIWEQRLAQNQTLRVAAFDYRVNELIGQVSTDDGMLQYQNQAQIRARGLEAAWRANWQSGAQLVASLSYSQTKDADGERPGYSPRWLAKLRGSVPVPGAGERWLVALEARAQSATDYVWNDSKRHLPLRLVVDATLTSARLTPGLDAFVRVRNVFDRRYDHPGTSETAMAAIPGDRRTWEIGLSYAF